MILENQTTTLLAQPKGKKGAENGLNNYSPTESDQVGATNSNLDSKQNEEPEQLKIKETFMLQVPDKIPEVALRHADIVPARRGTGLINMQLAANGSHLLEKPNAQNSAILLGVGDRNVINNGQGNPIDPDSYNQLFLLQNGAGKGKFDLTEYNTLPLVGRNIQHTQQNADLNKLKSQNSSQSGMRGDTNPLSGRSESFQTGIETDHLLNTASPEQSKINMAANTGNLPGEFPGLANSHSSDPSIENIWLSKTLEQQVPMTPVTLSNSHAASSENPVLQTRTIQLITQAASALQDGPVELTLNPEELGRVRMTLRSGEGTMMVTITVERPETLDLLRRNIDQLGNQLRDIGYHDLTFEFAGQGGEFSDDPDDSTNQKHNQPDGYPQAEETKSPDPVQIVFAHEGGIDVRL